MEPASETTPFFPVLRMFCSMARSLLQLKRPTGSHILYIAATAWSLGEYESGNAGNSRGVAIIDLSG